MATAIIRRHIYSGFKFQQNLDRPMKKNKQTMELLKQQLINKRIRETRKIPFIQLFHKIQYNGKGLLNDYNAYEKMKLLYDECFFGVKK